MDARVTSHFAATDARSDAPSAPHAPAAESALDPQDEALLALLGLLADAGYQFATPAPNTHRRLLLRRHKARTGDLADVLGWNRSFRADGVDPALVHLLDAAGMLERRGGWLRSRVAVASAGGHLYLHSSLSPRGEDHVFFGPDSYRFIDFLRAELTVSRPGGVIADIGAGAGVGGVFAAAQNSAAKLVMTDVNPRALRFARINAAFAGLAAVLKRCEGLDMEDGPFDLIVANPPYICDSGLTYSDGGGPLGSGLTLAWAKLAVQQLAPEGRLLLYSGAAIVDGHDAMRAALARVAEDADCAFAYRELDPDVFPATLLHPSYWRAERIAAIGAVISKSEI